MQALLKHCDVGVSGLLKRLLGEKVQVVIVSIPTAC